MLAGAERQRQIVHDRLTPIETPISIHRRLIIIQAESLDFNVLGYEVERAASHAVLEPVARTIALLSNRGGSIYRLGRRRFRHAQRRDALDCASSRTTFRTIPTKIRCPNFSPAMAIERPLFTAIRGTSTTAAMRSKRWASRNSFPRGTRRATACRFAIGASTIATCWSSPPGD